MNVGATYRISLELRDAAGDLFDPRSTPVLFMRSEDEFFKLRFSDPVHDGTGLYHRDVLIPDHPSATGLWSYFWDIAGETTGHYQPDGQLGPLVALQPTDA